MFRTFSILTLVFFSVSGGDLYAQRGGRDRGGDEGGERSDRGRDRGDRGGRGGEEGSERFRGGFGGGPPGGFGGGPPGGFGGGSFGGRGGFDPSSFLDRMDRNGNGMLDPDEAQGPASFMLQRLQREDSSINIDRPIPMSKVKEAFEKMRGGGGFGGRGGGDDDGGDEEGGGLAITELVPGFGGIELPPPVPGFGAAADLLAVRITDEDSRQAEETMRRYDRNRNQFIDSDELSGRWEGNPLDFDQNHDGRLSVAELSVRYARRRLDREDSDSRRREDDRRRRRGEEESKEIEVKDRFEGRTSYRRTERSGPEGVPGWFTDKDSDKDGQVRMSEFASEWTTELVEEFYGYDRNFDGVVTVDEAVTAAENGPAKRSESAAPSRAGSVAAVDVKDIDPKYISYAERIISRSDKNNDKELSASEWKEMIMDISPADSNRDAKITIEEYAAWLQARANTKK